MLILLCRKQYAMQRTTAVLLILILVHGAILQILTPGGSTVHRADAQQTRMVRKICNTILSIYSFTTDIVIGLIAMGW